MENESVIATDAQMIQLLKINTMNAKILVRLSNIIGVISIILLIYWVFTFVAIEVFGLDIFEMMLFNQGISQVFLISILMLLFGAFMINIMSNLTIIAQKHHQVEENNLKSTTNISTKKLTWGFALSFPIIFLLLLGADHLTAKKKENLLIASAKSIITDHTDKADKLLNYSFEEKWLIETGKILNLHPKMDSNFSDISVIMKDTLDKSTIFLEFDEYKEYDYIHEDKDSTDIEKPTKTEYILQTTVAERECLKKVFEGNSNEIQFSANNEKYELYYPYSKNNKKIILHLVAYKKHGRIISLF